MMKIMVTLSHCRPEEILNSSRKLRLPEFSDSRQMVVIRFTAISTGRLYLQEILLVLISVSN